MSSFQYLQEQLNLFKGWEQELREAPIDFLHSKQQQALVVVTFFVMVNLVYLGFYRTGLGEVRNLTNRLLLLVCLGGLYFILRHPMSSDTFRRGYFVVLCVYLGVIYLQTFYFTAVMENNIRTDFNEIFIATNNTVGVMILLGILLQYRRVLYLASAMTVFLAIVGYVDQDPIIRRAIYLPFSFVFVIALIIFYLTRTLKKVVGSLSELRKKLETEVEKQTRKLRYRRNLLKKTEQTANTGGWTLKPGTKELLWTDGTRKILGVDKEFVPTPRKALDFVHQEDRNTLKQLCEQCRKEGNSFDEQIRVITDDSTLRWIRIRGEAHREEGTIKQIRGAIQEITDQIQMQRELKKEKRQVEKLASRDSLTGLFNRRELMRRLEDEVERAKRYDRNLSIAILDLDHFSRINNQFGHQTGDEVLRDVGRRLRTKIRKGDFSARYGGEEFAIVCPETNKQEAHRLIERFRKSLGNYAFRADGETFHVKCSVGIAELESSEENKAEIISRADKALYEAKEQGRDRIEVI